MIRKSAERTIEKTLFAGTSFAAESAGASSGEFRFRDGREMELKGLAGNHQVFEVNLP